MDTTDKEKQIAINQISELADLVVHRVVQIVPPGDQPATRLVLALVACRLLTMAAPHPEEAFAYLYQNYKSLFVPEALS